MVSAPLTLGLNRKEEDGGRVDLTPARFRAGTEVVDRCCFEPARQCGTTRGLRVERAIRALHRVTAMRLLVDVAVLNGTRESWTAGPRA